jgi:hypothetical protein
MISGAHVIIHSKDADRVLFSNALGFPNVDAGHGWLIFALPPAEAAFHPADDNTRYELHFLCDDLQSEISALAKKGVPYSAVHQERGGSITKLRLPGGGEIGLYQPNHKTALNLKSGASHEPRR